MYHSKRRWTKSAYDLDWGKFRLKIAYGVINRVYMAKKLNRNIISDIRGMTLIDIAVAMMVIGLLATPLIEQYNDKRRNQISDATEGNNSSLRAAIEDFYYANGRYPCPAFPGLTDASVDIPNAANPATYGEEYCTGADDWDGSVDGALVGEAPFITLRLDVDKSIDGYKNRLTYAVTMDHADAGAPTFDLTNPTTVQISITPMIADAVTNELVCDFAAPLDINTIPYTIVSHGNSSTGATNLNGTLVAACPSGANTTVDSENCDGDAQFMHQQCVHNTRTDANHFDDTIFPGNVPSRIWPSAAGDEAVTEIIRVGIGQGDPLFELDIVGNIKATEDASDPANKSGNAKVADLCTNSLNSDHAPTTCFGPELLTGNEPSMRCDNNKAMTGISQNQTDCNITYISGNGVSCDKDTEYMTGIDANGDPICVPRQ